MSANRRLAAILVADVVGYSRLISGDESGTLARLHMLRQDIIEPSISKYSGRLFKVVGDGALVEFARVPAQRGFVEAALRKAGLPE